jgi:hypothetical protein
VTKGSSDATRWHRIAGATEPTVDYSRLLSPSTRYAPPPPTLPSTARPPPRALPRPPGPVPCSGGPVVTPSHGCAACLPAHAPTHPGSHGTDSPHVWGARHVPTTPAPLIARASPSGPASPALDQPSLAEVHARGQSMRDHPPAKAVHPVDFRLPAHGLGGDGYSGVLPSGASPARIRCATRVHAPV